MDGVPRIEYGFPFRYFIQHHEISDSMLFLNSIEYKSQKWFGGLLFEKEAFMRLTILGYLKFMTML